MPVFDRSTILSALDAIICRGAERHENRGYDSVVWLSLPFDSAKVTRLTITACGTTYFAGMVANYRFAKLAHLSVASVGRERRILSSTNEERMTLP